MTKKLVIGAIGIVSIAIIIFVVFFSLPANYKDSIRVNTHNINHFEKDAPQARVVVFSDLHLFYDYQVEDLRRVVEVINDANPDIVIFNGDLFHDESYEKDDEVNGEIISILREIKPMYGKFAILGEQDTKNDDARGILVNSDFEVLSNVVRNIRINEIKFNLIGLYNNGKQTKVLGNVSDKTFNFVVSHTPEIIESIQDYKIDVMVTGHTLGGQYNLPFYGSIFDNIRNVPHYKGFAEVNGINIYNSNGLGIYQSNMRFLAPSSIELFIIQ